MQTPPSDPAHFVPSGAQNSSTQHPPPLQTLRAQHASAGPPHAVQTSTELQTVFEPSHVRDLQQC